MKKAATLFAFGLFVMVGALAQAAEPGWLADFRKADLNDSGGLSKVELDKAKAPSLKAMRDNFAAIDTDRDGQITPAEYERFLAREEERFAARFKQADLNDSGGLSRKELDKAKGKEFETIKKNFAQIDADQDGQVTWEEYRAYLAGGRALARPAHASERAAGARDGCQPNCGIVTHVEFYEQKGEGTGLGAIAGGVAGGLLGSQVGKGTGQTIATVGGAAGGAYVGHQIEKKLKTKKMAKVSVRLDTGEIREFHLDAEGQTLAEGDRVRLLDGQPVRYTGQ
ncbi:MAG: EF-hand domain-containing protein [Rhodocyclaceae bacterium]|nr:EF-hand domain-containing protein [Rhodocyclaceae bacterium]